MGQSPGFLLCFIPLIMMSQAPAPAQALNKPITIIGIEQGSLINPSHYTRAPYLLQVGSFDVYKNALCYKQEIAKRLSCRVSIRPTKSLPIKYRVVIGPIYKGAQLRHISEQLLAQRIKPLKAKQSKPLRALQQTLTSKKRLGLRTKKVLKKSVGAFKPHQKRRLNHLAQRPKHPPLRSVRYGAQFRDRSFKGNLSSQKGLIQQSQSARTNGAQLLGAFATKAKGKALRWPNVIKKANKSLGLSTTLRDSLKQESHVASRPSKAFQIRLTTVKRETLNSPKWNAFNDALTDNSIHPVMPFIQLAAAETEVPPPINKPSVMDMDYNEKTLTYFDGKRKIRIDLTRYEPRTFKLAYDVFIMNGNVGFAFQVASVAVKNEPNNVAWREQLAAVALWTGNAEVALDQWLYLITHAFNPKKYLNSALLLAKQLFNYDAQSTLYQYELAQEPTNKDLLLHYNLATQQRGYPKKALKQIKAIPDASKDPLFLEQFIAITLGMDEPNQALDYLRQLIALDKTNVKARLKEAELLFSRGELESAYAIYSDTVPFIKTLNLEFWTDYAAIATLTGHVSTTIGAFKQLLAAKALHPASALQLIELEQLQGNLVTAYQDAQAIYRSHKDLRVGKLLLSIGADLNKWQDMKQFIDQLAPKHFTRLTAIPDYAILIALTNRHVGLAMTAFEQWDRILRRWPFLTTVQNGFLWYLIDNRELQQMRYVLSRWCFILSSKPALWEAYSAALSDIGNQALALEVALPHFELINSDYARLLGMADLFIQNDKAYTAYYLQRRAFYLLLNEIAPHFESLSTRQVLAYSELTRLFAPASLTYQVILKLSEQLFTKPEINDQIIAWALETQRYDLSGYLIKVQQLTGRFTPPWMALTQALEDDDRDLMQLLLSESPDLLPHRDRVTAAARIGEFKLAESYAYKGLSEHPYDAQMYDLFTETMLPRTTKLFVDEALFNYGNVTGPLSRLKARVFVTPSWAFIPYGVAWVPHTTAKDVIARTPSVDETVGFAARKYQQRGFWEVRLAERKSLARTSQGFVKWQREILLPRLRADLSAGYHLKADETTAMLLGGMKNQLKLGLAYELDGHNLYDAQWFLQRFLGQDRFVLGSGNELRLHWQHKFYLSYPDWNVNLYGSRQNYHATNKALPLLLQQMVPLTQTPQASFYMPLSDVNATLTLGFGQEYRDDYTHSWKPFAEAGIIRSKLLGWGHIIEGGFATSIFGRDHLVLHLEYAVNQQQVNQLINQTGPSPQQESQVLYNIGISYDYFF